MNTSQLADRIHIALNRELIRRLLTKYFHTKGFEENFDRRIYPPMLQDISIQVPQLMGKLEVVPWAEEIDPMTGVVRLGWNLFVLGNRRMYLGESTHTSLIELRVAVAGPLNNNVPKKANFATPRRVVNFISNVLEGSKNGDITCIPKNLPPRNLALPLGMNSTAGFFRQSQRPMH